MAKSVQSHANPLLIRWARIASGYETVEDLASSLKPSFPLRPKDARTRAKHLQLWEQSEDSGPTVTQLRKLAAFLRWSLTVFYLPEPPVLPPDPLDLRRAPEADAKPFSPEFRLLIRRARSIQAKASELIQMLVEPSSTSSWAGKYTMNDPPEEAAREIRAALGVTDLGQSDAAKKSGAESSSLYWIRAAEASGVIVMRSRDADPSDFLGLALHGDMAPLVMLNSADVAAQRRTFTLAHELAHLALGLESVSGDNDWRGEVSGKAGAIETWCNRVAGEMIMPWRLVAGRLSAGRWSAELIESIAKEWGVSRPVVAMRLLDNGHMSRRDYESYIRSIGASIAGLSPKSPRGSGSGNALRNLASRLGQRYIRLAYEAMNRDLISPDDLRVYLGMRLSHESVGKLAEMVEA